MRAPNPADDRYTPQTGFNSDMPHTEAPPAPKLAPGDQHLSLPNGAHADVVWHGASNSATVTLTDDLNQKIGTLDINQNTQTVGVKQYDPLTGKENKSETFSTSHGTVFSSPKDSFGSINMQNFSSDLSLSRDQRLAFTLQSTTGKGAPITVEIATNIKGWKDGGSNLTGQNQGIGAIVSMPASPGNEHGGDDGLLIGATGSGNSKQMTAEYMTNFQHPGAQDYDGPAATAMPSHDTQSGGIGDLLGADAGRFLSTFLSTLK